MSDLKKSSGYSTLLFCVKTHSFTAHDTIPLMQMIDFTPKQAAWLGSTAQIEGRKKIQEFSFAV
jgi:hypothetical protein